MATQDEPKVGIVTGGASGIGRALCEALCKRGTHVIVADIDLAEAEQVASALRASGGRASAAFVDVSDAKLVEELVADAASEHRRLDYMFNNAAATAHRGELGDIPLQHWHHAIDVNLLGVLHGTIAAESVMSRQGFGHIVNIGSLAGLVGYPTSIPYSATKAAVVNLSLSLRMEAADRGVHVTVVCPGPIHGDKKHPLKLIGVEQAALRILKGVDRNRAILVFPWHARVLWWLYRLSPNVLFPIGRKMVRDFRRRQKVGQKEFVR
jgi:NAD(P)-dependent dehydrogenase (short-subunit alcohol dehydrogenase family)